MQDAVGSPPPRHQAPGHLEGPAELLVHGPQGPCDPWVHAQLQRQGQDDGLGDEIETLDVIDAHPRHRPPLHTAQLQENLGHCGAIQGAPRGAETKGTRVRRGLLPPDGLFQPDPRPQAVDHGEDR